MLPVTPPTHRQGGVHLRVHLAGASYHSTRHRMPPKSRHPSLVTRMRSNKRANHLLHFFDQPLALALLNELRGGDVLLGAVRPRTSTRSIFESTLRFTRTLSFFLAPSKWVVRRAGKYCVPHLSVFWPSVPCPLVVFPAALSLSLHYFRSSSCASSCHKENSKVVVCVPNLPKAEVLSMKIKSTFVGARQ